MRDARGSIPAPTSFLYNKTKAREEINPTEFVRGLNCLHPLHGRFSLLAEHLEARAAIEREAVS